MMRTGMSTLAALAMLTLPAKAWWDEGHMQVAAMAWDLLTPTAQAEATRLIKLNPQYKEWVATFPPGVSVDRYAFIRAAVWADDIKLMPLYKQASDDAKDDAVAPFAGRNIGYKDPMIHGYWHYKDIAFTPDGSALPADPPVDAVTQIRLFTAALPQAAGKPDDVRSYDLVWLLHLVGDVHQPLHATAMFTKHLSQYWADKGKPDQGDRGGNEITVTPANGQDVKLHAYFDGMFGGYSTVWGAINDLNQANLPPADDAKTKITDPDAWVKESFDVAKAVAYAEPVLSAQLVEGDVKPAELDRDYEKRAREASKLQTPLAAARLARLLNEALK